ncbi:MAG TPA: glycosyl hydrolase 108 family protein [Terriglobales bacterium]|nr:glycosyl hydrolase 108 family protein [Terriglobales bacterium]
MSANFDRAFGIVVGLEAGYVDDPADPGHETKYGISKRAYPHEDIPNMTLERAKFLYQRDYWNSHDLDSLEWGKALLVFDCAVNGGNHQRWYAMYGGYRLPDFVEAFQAERFLYLASLPGFSHDGRGWSRRIITIALTAVQP